MLVLLVWMVTERVVDGKADDTSYARGKRTGGQLDDVATVPKLETNQGGVSVQRDAVFGGGLCFQAARVCGH
jgi:hypothetical protein